MRLWFSQNNPVIIVTYKIYIKSDYKPVVRWEPDLPWYLKPRLHVWLLICFIASASASIISSKTTSPEWADAIDTHISTPDSHDGILGNSLKFPSINIDEQAPVALSYPQAVHRPEHAPTDNKWQTVKVASGDSLSLIFDRLKISPAVLHTVMTTSPDTASLKNIMPGQEIRFHIEDGKLHALEFDRDIVTTVQVNRTDDNFTSTLITHELRKNVLEARATIDSSLFIAGQRAGLSDNLIMQLVAIYGWDIDFALDIRKGDSFSVIYEEQYKDEVKVSEGPILAAEFINRGKSYRSVRYQLPDSNPDYFADNGDSMRKAFLRTPLNFTRISSNFNLNRRHPVLNTIRAHKGVDYAAPTGTPIKASGSGTITHLGNKGGYGKTIIINHGGTTYSTLYAHLSNYARGLKKGARVRQGQTIGYVGMTGLATGPHLHYEFLVNGVHRNPLTVELPKAESIPAELMADFKKQTTPLLAQLDGQDTHDSIIVALRSPATTDESKITEN